MRVVLAILAGIALVLATFGPWVLADSELDGLRSRANTAADVLEDLVAVPEGIPEGLRRQSQCIAVVPNVIKAAILFGGWGGYGVATCRTPSGWSPPLYLQLRGGSLGYRIDAETSDVVLVFVEEQAARQLAKMQLDLGGDVSMTSGPYGPGAATEMRQGGRSEVYSYVRQRGKVSGARIGGSVLSPDDHANEVVYGPRGANALQWLIIRGPEFSRLVAERFQRAAEKYAPSL
jgi:SH3 domain-containing YSC84-like protein 1